MPALPNKFTLKSSPLFVGSMITKGGLKLLAQKKRIADCVEVRVDHLLRAGLTVKKIALALSCRKHPVLLTLRVPAEGGVYRWKKGERAAIALLLLSQAELIDLEVAELAEMRLVLKIALRQKKGVVLSAHAIRQPATAKQLRTWIKKFRTQRATYYKIASQIKKPKDLQNLVDILKKYPRQRWALMGLGPDAAHSRKLLTTLGSCAVYGYLDKPAASGQPSITQLARILTKRL